MERAGLWSLAVSLPRAVRTNDFFRARHPEVVKHVEEKASASPWVPDDGDGPAALFDRAMAPYARDPFRGTVRRHVLSDGETLHEHGLAAARSALAAAHATARDVDLIVSVSFLPDQLGVGDAPFLARDLDARCAAWNLEAACAGGAVALSTAASLVRSGAHRVALVVVGCSYSRWVDEASPLAWPMGDGAAAFVIGAVPQTEGVLGSCTVHTAETCDVLRWAQVVDASGAPRVWMQAGEGGLRVLRETAERHLRHCCEGAAREAGVRLSDVDLFVFNTPVAWFADFATRALGVDGARTIDRYADFGNMGPVLMPLNLHEAARAGRVRRGDLVLVYSVGSVSAASATVMRWGDVRLGSTPA